MKVRGGFLISLKSDKAYHTLSGSHTPDPLCLAAEKHMHHTKKEREELAERKKIGRLELHRANALGMRETPGGGGGGGVSPGAVCYVSPTTPFSPTGSGAVEVVLSSLI